MSHKKFEHPRYGHMGLLPKKKCLRIGNRAHIRSFPKDNKKEKAHLTAFLGYKAGVTHIVRDLNKPGSKLHKKEILEEVTLIETPKMVCVGLTGYFETPFGTRNVSTVWSQHLDESFIRRYYRNYAASRKLKFKKHSLFYNHLVSRRDRRQKIQKIIKYSKSIRIICHTQPKKLPFKMGKKAHIVEIQINGGTVLDKVKFAFNLLEKTVSIQDVVKKNDLIDIMSITTGHGFKGVVSRWGVRKLPRKTHKGLRKVACIGSWHPARVSWAVARAGQKGFFHRTVINKKVFMVGKDIDTPEGKIAGKTEFDLTDKGINPMGGFRNYGYIKNEFLMLRGSVPGPIRRCISIRQCVQPTQMFRQSGAEQIVLKFIDTAAKSGRGHFQTAEEKKKFFGVLKKERNAKVKLDLEKSRQSGVIEKKEEVHEKVVEKLEK